VESFVEERHVLVCQTAADQRADDTHTTRRSCRRNRRRGDPAGRHSHTCCGETRDGRSKTCAEHAALPEIGIANDGFARRPRIIVETP
jgi:hypothetical protein